MKYRNTWLTPDGTDWVELSRGPLGVGWHVSSSYHWVTGTKHADSYFYWLRKNALIGFETQASVVRGEVELNWYYKEMSPHKWEVWRYN